MRRARESTVDYGGYERCPASEMWRLELDRNRQIGVYTGARPLYPNSFDERDVGYLRGCFSGFEFVLQSIQNKDSLKLNSDFLQRLHKAAVAGATRNVAIEVKGEYKVSEVPFSSEFRNITETGYPIVAERGRIDQNATEDGIRELLQEFHGASISRIVQVDRIFNEELRRETLIKTELRSEADLVKAMQSGKVVAVESRPKTEVSAKEIQREVIAATDALFANFLIEEGQAQGDSEKIQYAIARLIRGIEVIHPFEDGNCRVLNKLMNVLLIRNGLSPAVLTNPNRIDAYSIVELVNQIKEGSKNFMNICLMQSDIAKDDRNLPYEPIGERIKEQRCCYLKNNPIVAMIVSSQIVSSVIEEKAITSAQRKRLVEKVKKKLEAMGGLTQNDLHNLKVAVHAKVFNQEASLNTPPKWTDESQQRKSDTDSSNERDGKGNSRRF